VIVTIVLTAVLAVLVLAFIAFYRYSRTPEWGDSDVRKAALGILVSIGPLWGMHFKAPRPELPTVTAPGPDPEALPTWGDDGEPPPALGEG
jgi:hypothetical protein